MKTLFASFYLSHIGIKASRVFIVENAKAECLSVLTIALSDLDLFIDTPPPIC